MNQLWNTWTIRLTTAGFLGLFLAFAILEETPRYRERPAKASSLGTKDDPFGRVTYEWLRVRDPATGQIPASIRQRELEFAQTLPVRKTKASAALEKGSASVLTELATWSRRGPHNLGGRTRALAYDISNTSIILAGGVSGGMWRSLDGGASWAKTTLPSQLHSVTCLAQDTRSGRTATWYYGTGEFSGNSATGGGPAFYNGDGIYKSTNGGASWSVLPSTSTGIPQLFDQLFDYVWNIAIDPSNTVQDEVYAATYGAIFRSTNGGSTWTAVRGGASPYSTRTDVQVTSSGVVYAAGSFTTSSTMNGIWRSPDGTTWTNITPSNFPTQYGRIVIGIAPSNENVVYFVVEGTNGTNGVDQINGHQFWKYTYISGNGSGAGGTWENRGVNLPSESGLPGNALFDTQGGYDVLVKVKPDDENFVIAGSTNLYRSTNAFATSGNWTRIGGYAGPNTYAWYTNHHPDQHSGMFLPGTPTTFISGHDEGVSRTTAVGAGTVSWTSLNNGYYTTQFYTVAIDNATSGNNVVIGGMQDNGTWFINTTTSTSPWVSVYGGDGAFCAIADGRTSYYASAQNGIIYRFVLDANGNLISWTRVDPTGGSGYLFINPFILDPSDTRMMYLAGGSSLWRNSDLTLIPLFSNSTASLNWTNLTNSGISGTTITALGASTGSPARRLYYGSANGRVYRLDNAHTATASTNPVDVWTGKGFPAGAYVSAIAVDPTNGDRAMVCFSNYSVESIYFTTNGGTSWTAVSGNLEQNPGGGGNGPSVRWVSILPFNGTTYYFAGTSTGLYTTTTLNGSSTVWAQDGATTIGNVVVDMMAVRTLDGLVVVGTHGNGVWSGIASPVSVEEPQVPVDYVLHQNYPNPFNPSTTIEYSVPTSTRVKLAVYDAAGREVAALVDEEKPRGNHIVTFDASNFASGVYFYRLQAGQVAETKRMVYLK